VFVLENPEKARRKTANQASAREAEKSSTEMSLVGW